MTYKVNIYLSTAFTNNAKTILKKFAEGVSCTGDTTEIISDITYKESDVAVITWSPNDNEIGQFRKEIIEKQKSNDRKTIIIEQPIIRKYAGPTQYRVGMENPSAQGIYNIHKDLPEERLKALDIKIKPWERTGSYYLIAGQYPTDYTLNGIDIFEWCKDIFNEVKEKTNSNVLIRPHPKAIKEYKDRLKDFPLSYNSLEADLNQSKKIISYASGLGVDSIINGTQHISLSNGSFAWNLSGHSLENILDEITPNRKDWLKQLSFCQWTLEEIKKGLPWLHLKELVDIKTEETFNYKPIDENREKIKPIKWNIEPPKRQIWINKPQTIIKPKPIIMSEPKKDIKMSGKIKALYVPWIKEHGDSIIKKLEETGEFDFTPLDVKNLGHYSFRGRKEIADFSKTKEFDSLIRNELYSLHRNIDCLIMTADWFVTLSKITKLAKEFKIPTILIPHESVYENEKKFYSGKAPVTDYALVWGNIQKRIFEDRGYPSNRIKICGSMKLDTYTNFVPKTTKKDYCEKLNLKEDKPIILYSVQLLDHQWPAVAREIQEESIMDVIDVAGKNNWQVVVRPPPAHPGQAMSDYLLEVAEYKSYVAIDGFSKSDSASFSFPPEEALFHSDMIIAMNSTMLFEGFLLGKPTLVSGYMDFSQIWHKKGGMPKADCLEDFEELISNMLEKKETTMTEEGITWATTEFHSGFFDGNTNLKITDAIKNILNHKILKL